MEDPKSTDNGKRSRSALNITVPDIFLLRDYSDGLDMEMRNLQVQVQSKNINPQNGKSEEEDSDFCVWDEEDFKENKNVVLRKFLSDEPIHKNYLSAGLSSI